MKQYHILLLIIFAKYMKDKKNNSTKNLKQQHNKLIVIYKFHKNVANLFIIYFSDFKFDKNIADLFIILYFEDYIFVKFYIKENIFKAHGADY